jgi:hypothetical protein
MSDTYHAPDPDFLSENAFPPPGYDDEQAAAPTPTPAAPTGGTSYSEDEERDRREIPPDHPGNPTGPRGENGKFILPDSITNTYRQPEATGTSNATPQPKAAEADTGPQPQPEAQATPESDAPGITIEGERRPPRERVTTINGLPAIELPCPGRPLSDFAAEVGSMLSTSGVYSRGGLAFTVDHATKQLSPVDPQWLRTWAEREVSLFKHARDAAGFSITLRHTMSLDVAKALVVSPQFLEHLPEIKRYSPVRMPIMRGDGRIELLPNGFDPETLTLTDPDGCEYQTDIAPELGAKAIRGLLAEFPFADARSQAAAVSAMLTVYAGGLLPPTATTPAFIYLANAEGSGKTTLAQLAGTPYGVCDAESKPATEEEWQKTLLALVMGGARLLLLDNLKGHLNSPSFEAYLTATKFSGRVLGFNKKFSGDADAVVLLTGNRLTVSPDLRRRCIFVELFMEELRAEDRVFKRRLDAPAILAAQPDILASLWCMVRGWDKAGRPPASKINSGVGRWSEVIAGIVEWAGFGCPSVPADIEDGGDTDTRDISRLCAAMLPDAEMKFADLCDLCASNGLFERFTEDAGDEGSAGLKARKGLSAVLKTYCGRMVTPGRRFTAEGKGHQRRYIIRETGTR